MSLGPSAAASSHADACLPLHSVFDMRADVLPPPPQQPPPPSPLNTTITSALLRAWCRNSGSSPPQRNRSEAL